MIRNRACAALVLLLFAMVTAPMPIAAAAVPAAGDCPPGLVCDADLGLALRLPDGWRVAPPAGTPAGHWVLEIPGSSGQAGAAVRLDISLLGTSPDPDPLRAERTGMDLVERGIAIDDDEGSTMAVAGSNAYLPMVMAHGIPGVAGEAHVLALAHAGAVYEVVAPGDQKNGLAADQVQALAGLRFVGPPPAPRCRFVLGFATLERLLYRQVGFCLEDEQHNPANGDGLQHTTGGLLVWRKADNWTAFTDGYRTWVNGPSGLEGRLNTQRFPWEANPDRLPVVPDSPYGPRPPAPPYAGPLLRVAPLASAVSGPLTLSVTVSPARKPPPATWKVSGPCT